MTRRRKGWNDRWAWAACAALIGCAGYSLNATSITSNGAMLNANVTCNGTSSTDPCTYWFQYWQDGTSTVHQTAATPGNVNTNGYINVGASLSGLLANTVYRYEVCGYGDGNINPPGICTGTGDGGNFNSANAPGTQPTLSDFSTTSNFRTASSTTKGTADIGRVISTADTSQTPITRDSGFSVQYAPGQSLWLFDDTTQQGQQFIHYGTAAAGAFTAAAAPYGLHELPTPPTAIGSAPASPAPFYPAPVSLQESSGAACGTTPNVYAADWNMGAAKEPNATRVLIVWGEICVQANFNFPLERVAMGEYDPVANKFLRVDHPFVASPLKNGLPGTRNVGSPIFPGDGYVYFFAAVCNGGFCSGVNVVRVGDNPTAWSNGANYKWWNGGTTWGAESGAKSVLSSSFIGGSVNVADYSAVSSKKWVMIQQTNLGVAPFSVYTATSPLGPWTPGSSAVVPETACIGGPNNGNNCYAIKGHPELSTSSQLVYSWYSPDDRGGFGHIRLGVLDW